MVDQKNKKPMHKSKIKPFIIEKFQFMANQSVHSMTLLKRKKIPGNPCLRFPGGGHHQSDFIQINLIRSKEKGNQIKITYRKKQYEVLPFSTDEEQRTTIEFLKQDEIVKHL